MAVRPVDGNAIMRKAWNITEAWKEVGQERDALLVKSVVEKLVDTTPTLTPPNEWVSVEDAVPDPGERVLAANGNFVGEAYMASNGAWMRHDGFPWEVDAWMPMPDRCPPEGEE